MATTTGTLPRDLRRHHTPYARLKGVSFETAIIERYCRRENSVEEALIERYLAGVSVRRAEDITEVLWGSKKYMNMKHLEAVFDDTSIAG